MNTHVLWTCLRATQPLIKATNKGNAHWDRYANIPHLVHIDKHRSNQGGNNKCEALKHLELQNRQEDCF